MNELEKLLSFLDELDRRTIQFTLARSRSEAVMVCVAVPGERWEIEFFGDGHVEVEVFGTSQGEIQGEEALARLLRENDERVGE